METEKNLHAAIPPALLARVQNVAQAERITVDELVRDAVQRRLLSHEWQEVLAFGELHSAARRLKEADVADAIAQVRRGDHGR